MGGDSWDRTDTLYLTELDDMADRQGGARAEFRIGLLLPMCGAAGLWAPSCISCAQVALRELNRGDGIAGRPVRLILIDAAEDATRAQQTEYAEQFAATSDLSESVAELRASYMRHVKLARVLFPPGTGEHTTLGLSGDRRDDLPGLIAQTEAFYRALLADARLLARTETVRLDQASAEAGLAQVEAVEAARAWSAKRCTLNAPDAWPASSPLASATASFARPSSATMSSG